MASSASRPALPELSALGDRVHVRTVRAEDVEPYRRAVAASAERIRRWNPVDPDDFARRLATQSADNRTFFVLAREPVGEHAMVGRVNLTGAVRGRFRSVAMGYDSYDPYAGRGLFAEGLRLVVGLALTDTTGGGMDLHRVEASVQSGNVTSAGLLRSLGFRREGYSERMLFLADETGREAWRDQVRYAITREEWPAPAYPESSPHRLVVLFDTEGTQSGAQFARAVSRELGLPLLPVDLSGLTDVLASCPQGAVVAGPLSRAGLDEAVSAVRTAEPGAVRTRWVEGTAQDARAVTRCALLLGAGRPPG